jgi:hypothetical protein
LPPADGKIIDEMGVVRIVNRQKGEETRRLKRKGKRMAQKEKK